MEYFTKFVIEFESEGSSARSSTSEVRNAIEIKKSLSKAV